MNAAEHTLVLVVLIVCATAYAIFRAWMRRLSQRDHDRFMCDLRRGEQERLAPITRAMNHRPYDTPDLASDIVQRLSQTGDET